MSRTALVALAALASMALVVGVLVPCAAVAAPGERPDPSHPRVVLIGPSADHPTVARVRDELMALGFDVQFETVTDPPQDLASVAQRAQAPAVAYVQQSPPEVVIWVDPADPYAAPSTEGLLHVTDSFTEDARAEQLAVRAAELLRGKLLRVSPWTVATVASAQPSTPGRGPPAPTVSALAPSPSLPSQVADRRPADAAEDGRDHRSSHGTIGVGPALLMSPGGVPVMPQIRIAGGYNIGWRIGLEGSVTVPTIEATVSADGGDVGLRALALAGAVTIELTPEDMDFGVLAGLGMGATAVFFDGEARPPHAGARGTRWAAAPQVQLAARYRFHPLVAVRLDVVASLLAPEPVVRIAGEEVGSFGQPAVLTALGLEVLP